MYSLWKNTNTDQLTSVNLFQFSSIFYYFPVSTVKQTHLLRFTKCMKIETYFHIQSATILHTKIIGDMHQYL